MIRSFVKNGRLMSLAIALILVSGFGALSNLPRTEDPRILNRMASAFTVFPGASAERVEVLVTEKIEQKLRKLPEIDEVVSTSRPGISSVQITLKDSIMTVAPVWSRVRDLLNDVKPELPTGVHDPILEDDRGYAYTQLISLKWLSNEPVDKAALGRYANELQNRLKVVPGTDIVTIFGRNQEEVRVNIDQSISTQIDLSIEEISGKVLASDAKVSAGQLVNSKNQMQIELTGALSTTERISNIPIRNNEDGSLLRLGEIAKIEKTLEWPAKSLAVANNQETVVVGTRMLPNLRIDKWTVKVEQALEDYKRILPHNIELEILFDQNTYTETRLTDLVQNIAIGFGLICIVLFVSLGWRSALIVSASLPLTIFFTLSVMHYYGLPIHQMSVTGLVVALGIMVDNAIVMTDTIQTKRQEGVGRLNSVSYAVKHLWLPLLGSTATTVLAFMPIVLMPGSAGEFIGGIALSVIFSLIGSYIISHTIVAGLAGRFLPKGESESNHWYTAGIKLPKLNLWFEHVLHLALKYRKTAIVLVFMLPLTGFLMAKHLSEQFFPASDRDMFQIELYLPVQSSIYNTETVSKQISNHLNAIDGITHVRWFIGESAPSFYYNMMSTKDGAQYYAQGMITTENFYIANQLIPRIQRELDELLPNAQILVRKLEQGPPFNAPVELRIFGPNLDVLKTIGEDIRLIMSETKDVFHTRMTLQPGAPKVWVEVDEESAALAGLSLVDIAKQLEANLDGRVNGSIIESTESIPVRVRLTEQSRSEVAKLANMNLVTPTSAEPVPLTAIATLSLRPTRGAIPHRDGSRVNTVEAYIRSGVLPSVALNNILANIENAQYKLPSGYTLEVGGESAERDEAVGQLLASIGLIFTLLITVVVLSFNSFRLSSIIFFSAFQSIGLGLLSIYLFDYPFGFTVIIGLLGLMGLAINAAIVIIAELKANRLASAGNNNEIVRCVQSCTRHISSTTITTVGGFLPLIIAGGGFWPPFAVAIAGGTVLTTLLSFIFVPTAFAMFSQKSAFNEE